MDHPADDIDLAVIAGYAHGCVRALIAFTEQLQRTARRGVALPRPRWRPGSWTWAPTTSGSSAADGCWPTASGASSVATRGWRRWCGSLPRRPTPTGSHPSSPTLRGAGRGLRDHRRHRADVTDRGSGLAAPRSRGGTRCCWIWTGSCRRRGWSAMTSLSSSWTAATKSRTAIPKVEFHTMVERSQCLKWKLGFQSSTTFSKNIRYLRMSYTT